MKIAILCVGNRLMLDDGIGPAVYDELTERYCFPEDVTLFDVGCMSMNLLSAVQDSDLLIAVDAVDGTGEQSGTVFRFTPEDMAGHVVMRSLHDMRLVDLLNAAALLGYETNAVCYGMQVANMSPEFMTEGLTPQVHAALPLLVESVLAELVRQGVQIRHANGTPFVAPTSL